MKMTSSRKWRFPVLIGGGIVAAGVLFYLANGHVNSRATQGTIAHRDVYRDADVTPGDVATPGTAPVAVKAVLESKDFQKLAKNQAFANLMNSSDFHKLATNQNLLALVNDKSFVAMAHNSQFQSAIRSEAFVHQLQTGMAHGSQANLNQSLLASNAQGLVNNPAFLSLVHNGSFQALMHENAFHNLLASHSFTGLVGNSNFQGLISSGSFQSALQQGSAASLNTYMAHSLQSNVSSASQPLQ